MAKRKTKPKTATKTSTKSAPKKQKSPAQIAVQEAGAITGRILGDLQNARKTFLRIGQLLTIVRNKKYFVTLHHQTIEEYADKRLGLSRRSLYRYLQVYAWALEHHKEWLETPTKVRIPDLDEIEGLVWVEQELARKNLPASRKTELHDTQQKALAGNLTSRELKDLRKSASSKPANVIPKLIADTRALKNRYAKTKSESARNCLPLFDQILNLMQNDLVVETAGLGILDDWRPGAKHTEFFDRNIQYA